MTIPLATLVLTFLAGLLGGNAFPHFVGGITKQEYPNVFGNGPGTNLVFGWVGLVIASVLVYYADVQQFALGSLLIGSAGVLVMSLFHARVGAFGKRSPSNNQRTLVTQNDRG